MIQILGILATPSYTGARQAVGVGSKGSSLHHDIT